MSDESMTDKLKGVAKESVGKVAGNESMEREGEAQQKKAQKQDEAERLEQAAKEKKADAASAEVDELRHQ